MTRTQLKSKCLLGIRNFSPETFIPNVDHVVAECAAGFARAIGGIPRTATITTVIDQQEYGTSDDFPSDFVSIRSVTKTVDDDVTPLGVTTRDDRYDVSGEPQDYYIERGSRIIGFDYIPDSAIQINLHYRGLGATPTQDSSVMLTELNAQDTDPVWKAIAHRFAVEYYGARLAKAVEDGDEKGIIIFENQILSRAQKMREIEYDYTVQLDMDNADQAKTSALPKGYFTPSGKLNHGRYI